MIQSFDCLLTGLKDEKNGSSGLIIQRWTHEQAIIMWYEYAEMQGMEMVLN